MPLRNSKGVPGVPARQRATRRLRPYTCSLLMAGRPLILLMAGAFAYMDDRRKTADLLALPRGLRGLLVTQAIENLRPGKEH